MVAGWLSSWHSKDELASLERIAKVAVLEFTVPAGPESMKVFGAPVSTVNVRVAGVWSVLPSGSLARTENVYEPCESRLYCFGELQFGSVSFTGPLSVHSKVTGVSS